MYTNEQLLAPLLKVWVSRSVNGMILILLKDSGNQAPKEKVNVECAAFYTGFPARVVNTQYYSGLHAIAVAATIKARLYDIGYDLDEYDDYEEEGREYEEEGENTEYEDEEEDDPKRLQQENDYIELRQKLKEHIGKKQKKEPGSDSRAKMCKLPYDK
ncbi:hypothetical protein Tco_1038936 [Tanacetum coccineum]